MSIPEGTDGLNPTGFDLSFDMPAFCWAAMYRAAGLQVIPSYFPGEVKGSWKRPLPSWADLQDSLAPAFTFDRWYGTSGEHRSRANMGILTGRCSDNVFVIDLDIQKEGNKAAQWWHGLLAIHNSNLPIDTPTQQTGGGGLQMLLRAPQGFAVPTNRTSIGVDIRGQGGFAVMPPSRHESGKEYAWMPGMAPWEIPIAEAPEWLLDEILELVEAHGGEKVRPERTASPEGDRTAFGSVQDGRESFMAQVVWRTVLELYRRSPIRPGREEEGAAEYAGYEAYEREVVSRVPDVHKRTGLEQEGRGFTLWQIKWRREMKKWGAAKMKVEAARPNPNRLRANGDTGDNSRFDPGAFEHKADEQAKANPQNTYEVLDAAQILAMRDPAWAIAGLVAEQAMGFIYGPPGTLKTFIGLDIALSFAAGLPQWWTRDINTSGAIVYISSEGQADLKFRLMAWGTERGVDVGTVPFHLIREGINFMKVEDVGKLLATVQAVADKTGKQIAAVFVDTVSRVLPGADENLQKDMTLFIAACDALRHRFKSVVVGIHHTARAGNMRGSTVMPGAGDFIVEVLREPGAPGGSIRAVKIKAGQDGWEQAFRIKQVPVGLAGTHTSLVINPDIAAAAVGAAAARGGAPDAAACDEILDALDVAFKSNNPWSMSRRSPRFAVRIIMERWAALRLKADAIEWLLGEWLKNKVIENREYNSRAGKFGLVRLRNWRSN